MNPRCELNATFSVVDTTHGVWIPVANDDTCVAVAAVLAAVRVSSPVNCHGTSAALIVPTIAAADVIVKSSLLIFVFLLAPTSFKSWFKLYHIADKHRQQIGQDKRNKSGKRLLRYYFCDTTAYTPLRTAFMGLLLRSANGEMTFRTKVRICRCVAALRR